MSAARACRFAVALTLLSPPCLADAEEGKETVAARPVVVAAPANLDLPASRRPAVDAVTQQVARQFADSAAFRVVERGELQFVNREGGRDAARRHGRELANALTITPQVAQGAAGTEAVELTLLVREPGADFTHPFFVGSVDDLPQAFERIAAAAADDLRTFVLQAMRYDGLTEPELAALRQVVAAMQETLATEAGWTVLNADRVPFQSRPQPTPQEDAARRWPFGLTAAELDARRGDEGTLEISLLFGPNHALTDRKMNRVTTRLQGPVRIDVSGPAEEPNMLADKLATALRNHFKAAASRTPPAFHPDAADEDGQLYLEAQRLADEAERLESLEDHAGAAVYGEAAYAVAPDGLYLLRAVINDLDDDIVMRIDPAGSKQMYPTNGLSASEADWLAALDVLDYRLDLMRVVHQRLKDDPAWPLHHVRVPIPHSEYVGHLDLHLLDMGAAKLSAIRADQPTARARAVAHWDALYDFRHRELFDLALSRLDLPKEHVKAVGLESAKVRTLTDFYAKFRPDWRQLFVAALEEAVAREGLPAADAEDAVLSDESQRARLGAVLNVYRHVRPETFDGGEAADAEAVKAAWQKLAEHPEPAANLTARYVVLAFEARTGATDLHPRLRELIHDLADFAARPLPAAIPAELNAPRIGWMNEQFSYDPRRGPWLELISDALALPLRLPRGVAVPPPLKAEAVQLLFDKNLFHVWLFTGSLKLHSDDAAERAASLAQLRAGLAWLDKNDAGFPADSHAAVIRALKRLEAQAVVKDPPQPVRQWEEVRLVAALPIRGPSMSFALPVAVGDTVHFLRQEHREAAAGEAAAFVLTLCEADAAAGPTRDVSAFQLPEGRPQAALEAVVAEIGRGTPHSDRYLQQGDADDANFYAATYGDGLLVFPRDGSEPYAFDEAQGLPSNYVHGLAATPDGLFCWVGMPYRRAVFARVDVEAKTVETLASSSNVGGPAPLDGRTPLEARGFWRDDAGRRVLFRIDGHRGGSGWDWKGIWAYDVAEKRFKQLVSEPNLHGREAAPMAGERALLLARGEDGHTKWERLDLTDDALTEIPLPEGTAEAPPLFRPLMARDGRVWCGGPLAVYDLTTQTVEAAELPEWVENPSAPPYLREVLPLPERRVLLTMDKQVWIARLKGAEQPAE